MLTFKQFPCFATWWQDEGEIMACILPEADIEILKLLCGIAYERGKQEVLIGMGPRVTTKLED